MKTPKIGDLIFIPSSFYISHGADDIMGGEAEISEILLSDSLPENHFNYIFIKLKGFSKTTSWNYKSLMNEQIELKEEYGSQKAKPDPDLHPDSNPVNYGW